MMRTNFQSLAKKFSVLNERNNKDFISFYEENEQEIKDLKNFETDEDLYLAVVINHTYGRSLLYEAKAFKKAEQFLVTARTLILEHEDKFKIKLKEDIWYLQTLQHLLTTYLTTKNKNKALKILKELAVIDEDNRQYYELEEREIKRIQKYKILMTCAYIGLILLIISIVYRFLANKPLLYVGRIGQALALIGLIGAYFFRKSVKGNGPPYKSRPDVSNL